MGKKIDRAVIFILLIIFIYALYAQALGGSFVLALLLTFLTMAAFHRLALPRPFRLSAFEARSILEKWGYESDETARQHIETLIGMPEKREMVCIVRPLNFSLSKSDVFSHWKAHRGQDHLVIAATCHADGPAFTFAASLQSPAVEIIDASKLISRIRLSNLPPPGKKRISDIRKRLKNSFSELPRRRSWQKNILTGLLLMLLYLAGSNIAYLVLSVCALFIAGVSLRLRQA